MTTTKQQIPDLASIKRVFVGFADAPMRKGDWYYSRWGSTHDAMIRKVHALMTENAHSVQTFRASPASLTFVLNGKMYVAYTA